MMDCQKQNLVMFQLVQQNLALMMMIRSGMEHQPMIQNQNQVIQRHATNEMSVRCAMDVKSQCHVMELWRQNLDRMRIVVVVVVRPGNLLMNLEMWRLNLTMLGNQPTMMMEQMHQMND